MDLCERAFADEEMLLQGDILKVPGNAGVGFRVYEQYAMILTADCDIANCKMQGVYSLLPIVSVKNYLDKYYLPDQIKKMKKKYNTTLVEVISRVAANASDVDGKEYEVSIDSVESLVEEGGENLKESLARLAPNENLCEVLARLERIEGMSTVADFVRFKCEVDKAKKDSISKQIYESVINGLKEDFFYLPLDLYGESGGVVVLLRDIRTVDERFVFGSCLSLRLSNVSSAEGFYRIKRLSPVLKYAITQSFSKLFSRIGLSKEYEDYCDKMVRKIEV